MSATSEPHRISAVAAIVVFCLAGLSTGAAMAADGVWTYGSHPRLGPSAFVEIGPEAVAVACGLAGLDRARDDVVSVRITPGLLPAPAGQVAVLFDAAGLVGGPALRPVAGYAEGRGNTCETGYDAMRAGRAMLLIPGTVEGFDSRDGVAVTLVRQGGRVHALSGADDLSDLSGVVRVPLKGAGQALAKLAKACPAIRRDIDENCGI